MVELKTRTEIDSMADAGAVVAEALHTVIEQAKPGTTTLDLDRIAAEVLARHGASSPFLNYHPRWAPTPFPGVLCVSVNDAVVHGIPNDCVLADGDLVSVDFGATLRGWTGDAARSFIVGTPRDGDAALIEAATQFRRRFRTRASACSPTTVATASAARCTRIRTYPTKADPAEA